MKLDELTRVSAVARVAIILSSALYLLRARDVSALEFSGIKIEFGGVALTDAAIVSLIAIMLIIVLLDILKRSVEVRSAQYEEEKKNTDFGKSIKERWNSADDIELGVIQTSFDRTVLYYFAVFLLDIMPIIIGVFCVIDFVYPLLRGSL